MLRQQPCDKHADEEEAVSMLWCRGGGKYALMAARSGPPPSPWPSWW